MRKTLIALAVATLGAGAHGAFDIVQIRARSHVHAPPCGMLASQPQRSVARPVPIHGDLRRGGLTRVYAADDATEPQAT